MLVESVIDGYNSRTSIQNYVSNQWWYCPEVLGLPPNPIRGIEPIIAQRRQRGDIVHTLHIGNRTEDVDPCAAGALAHAFFRGELATLPYVQSAGTPEMRAAASQYFKGMYRPEEIVVTAGSSEAMLYYTMISQAPGEAM
jgi:aspartate/methionine/tyrosine aminotransferase